MDQRRIGNNGKASIPARFPQREPVLGIMICEKHVGVGVVAETIARAKNEQPMK